MGEKNQEEPQPRKKAKFLITEQGYALLRVDVMDIVRAVGMCIMFMDAVKNWFAQMKMAEMQAAQKFKVEKAKAESKNFINEKMK